MSVFLPANGTAGRGGRRLLLAVGLMLSVAARAAVPVERLAVVVNVNDPDSVAIAEYYRQKRGLPEKNLIRVALPVGKVLGVKRFNAVRHQILAATGEHIQFYALAWTRPFRVRCMSITSAMTFGFDPAYCARGCRATRPSVYFNSDSTQPYTDLGIRPTMMLAGESVEQVKAMIDRGVEADGSRPPGTVYLLSTSDRARNVRARQYRRIERYLSDRVAIDVVEADTLRDKPDVLMYFTGLKRVQGLRSNRFLPGAVADHLTSTGGVLLGSRQMSSLEWLSAGATASYGTVVEPCAFPQKFPNPAVVIDRYTHGESVIEAYWKSVAWPGQGVFIGEPLAAPFAAGGQKKPQDTGTPITNPD